MYCKSCDGTGLYVGFAEKDGCAVVCTTCKGTGGVVGRIYKRKERRGIKRVFAHSAGCGHAPTGKYKNDITNKYFNFEDGGCSYEEWKNGKTPLPVKGLYCPYLWTKQELQLKDKNGLYKKYCTKHLHMGSITDCGRYPIMDECWNIFEGDDVYLKDLKKRNVLLQYDYNIETDEVTSFEVEINEFSEFSEFVKDEDKLLEFVLFMNNKYKDPLYGFLKQYNESFCEKYKLILEG